MEIYMFKLYLLSTFDHAMLSTVISVCNLVYVKRAGSNWF